MDEHSGARYDIVRLLSFLASSLEEVTSTEACDIAAATLTVQGTHYVTDRRTQRAVGARSSRIHRLRRAYNIILFGSASHEEAIEQAEAEDISEMVNAEILADNNAKLFMTASAPRGSTQVLSSGSGADDLSSALSSLSTASLQLRKARRYDPANALDGLVDGLLARRRQDTSKIACVLRLLVALQNIPEGGGEHANGEVVGVQGRRVLQRLYSNQLGQLPVQSKTVETEFPPPPPTQQQQHIAVGGQQINPGLPDDMFLRHGQHRPPTTRDGPLSKANDESLDSVGNLLVMKAISRNRYLLPNDCVLHGDSIAADPAAGGRGSIAGFGIERMPWFTDAEFSSERGIPNISQGSSLSRCIAAVIHAPLSPTAWTRLKQPEAASGKVVPSFKTGVTGGAPAVPITSTSNRYERVGIGADTSASGRVKFRGHDDLCGAVHHRSSMDPRSPATKELRIMLSFPDLDNAPRDLLKAVQLQQSVAPTKPAIGSGEGNNGGSAAARNYRQLVRQRRLQAETFLSECGSCPGQHEPQHMLYSRTQQQSSFGKKGGMASLRDDGICGVGYTADRAQGAVTLRLHPIGWQRAEARLNDSIMTEWALAPAPLLTGEGGAGSEAFEVCYREHFAGVGGEIRSPAFIEPEMMRRALTVLQGVPSDIFWYDHKEVRMHVAGCRRKGAKSEGEGKADVQAASPVWREFERPPPRLAGSSPGSLMSFLEEFALAGTWYRRVEEFAGCLIDGSAAAGQVAQAFGAELRRQLTRLQAVILVVTTDVVASGRTSWLVDRTRRGSHVAMPGGVGVVDTYNSAPSVRSCSLAGILHRTVEIRRAAAALAEICGLTADDLGAYGGVKAAAAEFPRGASLLTHLYKITEARAASEPAECEHASDDCVPGKTDSAMSLLGSAAAPYLNMLGRWLWSGEMWKEDDPCEEFPLRCRSSPRVAGTNGTGGQSWAVKEPWMRDGGGGFMTEAFRENTAAGVPCFLDGGVLAAAARAGKVLRMLKLSSPEFFASCAASPPPPLYLVFDSYDLQSRESMFSRLSFLQMTSARSAARALRVRAAEDELRKVAERVSVAGGLVEAEKAALRMLESQREKDRASVEQARVIWVQGLNADRAAAAAAAAASTAQAFSPPSGKQGRSMLSFLEPPTSTAEAQAAATLRERYRLLGEEADARAARARWKRRRSERVRSARLSLKEVYTAETRLWVAELAATATMAAETLTPIDDLSSEGIYAVAGETEPSAIAALPESDNKMDGLGECRGMIDRSEHVDVELTAGKCELSLRALPMGTAATMPGTTNHAQLSDVHASDEDAQASGIATVAVDEEGDPDSARTGELAHDDVGNRYDSFQIKFSHVTITEEPGGKSTGVARALGGSDAAASGAQEVKGDEGKRRSGDEGVCLGDNDRPPALKFSHVTIVEEPGGSSAGVSQALGGAEEVSCSGSGSGELSRERRANASNVSHITTPDLHTGDRDVGTVKASGTEKGEKQMDKRQDDDEGAYLGDNGCPPALKFSHVTIVEEPGGSSAGVSQALGGTQEVSHSSGDSGGSSRASKTDGSHAAYTMTLDRHTGDGGLGMVNTSGTEEGKTQIDERRSSDEGAYVGINDRPPALKFSHITIVEEPGGSSAGVSQALGGTQEVSHSSGDSGGSSRESQADASHISHTKTPDFHTVSRDMEIGDVSGDGRTTEPERMDDDLIVVGEEFRSPVENDAPTSAGGLGDPSLATVHQEAFTGSQGAVLAQGVASESENLLKRLAPNHTVDESCVEGDEEGLGSRGGQHQGRTARHKQDVIKKIGANDISDAHTSFTDRRRAFLATGVAPSMKVRGTPRVSRTEEMSSSPLPLEAVVRRCVRDPVLAQCRAVDSAALMFLAHGAGAVEHFASLRMFLLGLNSGFLHEFTLRLLEGLYDGGVDWRRPSNLNAAFAASAAAAGLESAPLFDTFQYEVDLTHGGVFGGGGKLDSSARRQKIDGDIENVGWRKLEESGEGYGDASAHAAESQERYSSTALSYVNPVLAVSWPLGVLLPAGALRSYGSIHRALFRHQIALHRLRRLRLTLRALDVAMTSLKRAVVGSRRRAMDLSGTGGGGVREAGKMTMASWDCGRLHWVHLFRHEMQHMADSLQSFFAEQAEIGWPDLRQSLTSSTSFSDQGLGSISPQIGVPTVGGLAVLASAHSRYIQDMRRNMFLGNDRPGMVARARIEDLYEVVCIVSRVTDDLGRRHDQQQQQTYSPDDSSAPILHPTTGPAVVGGGACSYASSGRQDQQEIVGRSGTNRRSDYPKVTEEGGTAGRAQSLIVSDKAFAELVSARERFDTSRKGLCGALVKIAENGGGAHARPLLAILGYGGYWE